MLNAVIDTERLHLRSFRLGDAEDVFSFASDAQWALFLPVPQPYEKAHAEQFIARQLLLEREQSQGWAIEYDGTVIGGINIRFDADHLIAEIGYSIARTHWGNGFATEVARGVIDEAFSARADLRRIIARADARNLASHRVMERVGMHREGLLSQHRLLRGEPIDEVVYGILRSEWEAAAKKR